MFRTYDFSFAGYPASMYGLFVADIGNNKMADESFGNKANIVEQRIANRITPLHFGVKYNETPLQFELIFGSDHLLDKYECQEVSKWLTGHQDYQWLSIDQPDLDDKQFRCLIQELMPISIRGLANSFKATVICDCPYAYGLPFDDNYTVRGTSNIIYYNDGSCRELMKPHITITLNAGCTEFSIDNKTTGKKFELSGLPGDAMTIDVDNENCIMSERTGSVNIYNYFNFNFVGLASGDNEMIITGDTDVRIQGRFLYNVGA